MNANPPISRRSLLLRSAATLAVAAAMPYPSASSCSLFAQQASPPAQPWPLFRGNKQLHGIAPSPLPRNPKLLWTYDTKVPNSPNAVRSSPIVADGRIYIGADDMNLHALNPADGTRIWAYQTEDSIEAPPTYHQGAIYVGSVDGFMYKLDAATGELLWKFETRGKIVGAANTFQRDDGKLVIIFGSHDAILYGLDAQTGQPIWTYETDNFINATPAIENARTVFGGCDGFLHVVNVADGTPLAKIEIEAYVAASAALDGSIAYLGHYGEEFIAVDLDKQQIIWTYANTTFPYFSSPALTQDLIVVGCRDRKLHAINRADGSPKWTFSARRDIDSSPVIAGDAAVVGSNDGRLYIVNLADGTERWSYELGKQVISSPAVVNGQILIGCDDGNLYAFADTPES